MLVCNVKMKLMTSFLQETGNKENLVNGIKILKHNMYNLYKTKCMIEKLNNIFIIWKFQGEGVSQKL